MIVIAPCGFDIERARVDLPILEAKAGWDSLSAVRNGRVFDGGWEPVFQPAGSAVWLRRWRFWRRFCILRSLILGIGGLGGCGFRAGSSRWVGHDAFHELVEHRDMLKAVSPCAGLHIMPLSIRLESDFADWTSLRV